METFLRQHKDGFSFYHIVEPDAHYHCAILERAAKGQTNQIRLYSCALSDHREILRLRNYNNANSVVRPNGEIRVQAETVDGIFSDLTCTLFKIDVEGYELRVLRGAEKLLRRCTPVVAAAVYHNPEEFVETYEYLNALSLGYSFFLRSYMNLQETVLYAVPEERRL